MPALTSSNAPIKAIIAADSGGGKTGALWSLADAGFKLRVYDFDQGTPILASVLKDNKGLKNVEVCPFTDELAQDPVSGYMKPKTTAKAWPNFLKALNKWPDNTAEGANTWGPETVMVIDSLTLAGRAALRYAQQLEGKQRWKPELQHYGTAMAQIEALFASLYGDNCACHVLFMTHVKQVYKKVDDELEFVGAFPSSLGQALNEVIPRYVNDILTIKIAGQGPSASRYLSTKPTENRITTKTRDLATKDQYLLAKGREPHKGLAEYFADCGWSAP